MKGKDKTDCLEDCFECSDSAKCINTHKLTFHNSEKDNNANMEENPEIFLT